MLARIRGALGHAGAPSTPQPLPPYAGVVAAQADGLVSRFCDELEGVGGHVKRLRSAAEVTGYVARLLPTATDAAVAVSDSAAARRLGLREWLAERDVRVVRTLKEFAATEFVPTNSARGGARDAGLMEQYKQTLLRASLGITSADYAIAETGTLVLVSGGEQHRLISLLPPVHVCLLEPERIVPNLATLLARVRAELYAGAEPPPQALTFITGPSRTADIEHTLTMGVHGPSELHVVLHSFDD
ncbi:MAG TPA: lactate utilization protein [Pyrinomonadaceae bacterium]